LEHLADSEDEEIAEAVLEATSMANARWDAEEAADEDSGPLN
jgi:hypothetical protein